MIYTLTGITKKSKSVSSIFMEAFQPTLQLSLRNLPQNIWNPKFTVTSTKASSSTQLPWHGHIFNITLDKQKQKTLTFFIARLIKQYQLTKFYTENYN